MHAVILGQIIARQKCLITSLTSELPCLVYTITALIYTTKVSRCGNLFHSRHDRTISTTRSSVETIFNMHSTQQALSADIIHSTLGRFNPPRFF